MASNVIPFLSSSPPPLDNSASFEDDDEDDFGDFSCAQEQIADGILEKQTFTSTQDSAYCSDSRSTDTTTDITQTGTADEHDGGAIDFVNASNHCEHPLNSQTGAPRHSSGESTHNEHSTENETGNIGTAANIQTISDCSIRRLSQSDCASKASGSDLACSENFPRLSTPVVESVDLTNNIPEEDVEEARTDYTDTDLPFRGISDRHRTNHNIVSSNATESDACRVNFPEVQVATDANVDANDESCEDEELHLEASDVKIEMKHSTNDFVAVADDCDIEGDDNLTVEQTEFSPKKNSDDSSFVEVDGANSPNSEGTKFPTDFKSADVPSGEWGDYTAECDDLNTDAHERSNSLSDVDENNAELMQVKHNAYAGNSVVSSYLQSDIKKRSGSDDQVRGSKALVDDFELQKFTLNSDNEDDEFAEFVGPSTDLDISCSTGTDIAAFGTQGTSMSAQEIDDEFADFQSSAVTADQMKEEVDDHEQLFQPNFEEHFGDDICETLSDLPGDAQFSKAEAIIKSTFPPKIMPEFDAPSDYLESMLHNFPSSNGSLWLQLRDIEKTKALTYQWSNCTANKRLLTALNIDSRNLLFGHNWNSSIPIFAANLSLSPLEPVKVPLKAEERDVPEEKAQSTRPYQEHESIPPAQFDWNSSGLVNPLDVLESELLRPDADKQCASTAQPEPTLSPLLEQILSTAKLTATSQSTPKQEANAVGAEALKILEKLPDLSFMQAKVLMFPIRSSSP